MYIYSRTDSTVSPEPQGMANPFAIPAVRSFSEDIQSTQRASSPPSQMVTSEFMQLQRYRILRLTL